MGGNGWDIAHPAPAGVCVTKPVRITGHGWLSDQRLQTLLDLLSRDGEEARVNGGAVRNALLGEPVRDVDISTTCLPAQVIERLSAAVIKTVPTGIEHGTVTAVFDGNAYQITTLRQDIETDGRRASVRFGRNWQRDAERRDFTMNGLYCDSQGTIFDPLGGMNDLLQRRVRFIGEPKARIGEDYLRILRFFRFFAWYGVGRPDADGLRACAKYKSRLTDLSAERAWSELRQTLAAADPRRALLWMRTSGVLAIVVPESAKYGIDAIHPLIESEQSYSWLADAMVRLMAIVPDDPKRIKQLAKRLKLANAETKRLLAWAKCKLPAIADGPHGLREALYRGSRTGIADRLKLAIASKSIENDADAAQIGTLVEFLTLAETWRKPKFPLRGRDLIATGMRPGPNIAKRLSDLEERWIESRFALSREALLALI